MSKKEIRYALGLPNPDYRHKVYEYDDIVKTIVDLAIRERVGIVGNRLIYEVVTGLQRYSRKRWETLKPMLVLMSHKFEHEVDGKKYLISTYSPMFAGQFNFYADEARNRPVAGFTVFPAKLTSMEGMMEKEIITKTLVCNKCRGNFQFRERKENWDRGIIGVRCPHCKSMTTVNEVEDKYSSGSEICRRLK